MKKKKTNKKKNQSQRQKNLKKNNIEQSTNHKKRKKNEFEKTESKIEFEETLSPMKELENYIIDENLEEILNNIDAEIEEEEKLKFLSKKMPKQVQEIYKSKIKENKNKDIYI